MADQVQVMLRRARPPNPDRIGHFEFNEAGSLGMHLGHRRYPIEIAEVDEGTPAHQQGVPPNSVVVKVNGQPLEPNDDEDVREQVKEMLKQRPLTFDVVLRDAAGAPQPKRSRAVGVAGATSAGPRAQVHRRAHQVHDAGEGAAARMDCHELIDLLTAEEQEMVCRVLRKLLADRRGAGDGTPCSP